MKVHVRVGTSRIAGKGLFAAEDIKKGTRIIQYIGQRISKEETADRLYQGNQYIFTFNDRYTYCLSRGNVFDDKQLRVK